MEQGDLKKAQTDAADPEVKIIQGRYLGNVQDPEMLSGGRRAKPVNETAKESEGETRSFPRITGDAARNETPVAPVSKLGLL